MGGLDDGWDVRPTPPTRKTAWQSTPKTAERLYPNSPSTPPSLLAATTTTTTASHPTSSRSSKETLAQPSSPASCAGHRPILDSYRLPCSGRCQFARRGDPELSPPAVRPVPRVSP